MLPAEVDIAFLDSFVAGELGVLTDAPVGVAAASPTIARPVVEADFAVVASAEAGEDRFDICEELGCELVDGTVLGNGDIAACEVVQDSRRSPLRSSGLPSVLIAGICIRVATTTESVPMTVRELELQLAVVAKALLRNGRHFQRTEGRSGHVHRISEDGERQGEDDMVCAHDFCSCIGGEGEFSSAVGTRGDRGEFVTELNLAAQLGGHASDQLIIAAADMKPFIRFTEDFEFFRGEE